jgi:hypothetical protein
MPLHDDGPQAEQRCVQRSAQPERARADDDKICIHDASLQ